MPIKIKAAKLIGFLREYMKERLKSKTNCLQKDVFLDSPIKVNYVLRPRVERRTDSDSKESC